MNLIKSKTQRGRGCEDGGCERGRRGITSLCRELKGGGGGGGGRPPPPKSLGPQKNKKNEMIFPKKFFLQRG